MTTQCFRQRRDEFMRRIGPDAVAVIPAAPESLNGSLAHAYRQSADFYYLTGCEEPDWVLVLRPGDDTPETLFVRPRSPKQETYHGPRPTPKEAKAALEVDEVFALSELSSSLPALLANRRTLYYHLGGHPSLDQRLLRFLTTQRGRERYGQAPPLAIHDLSDTLHEMRVHKDEGELALMRKAAAISTEAHITAMREARAGSSEYALQAALEATFRRNGARGPAYESIVGAGIHATVLHYRANRAELTPGELVLIDAGCDYQYYNADITRTFPVDGTFAPRQRVLYEGLLAAQEAAIAAIRPGLPFEEVHNICVRGVAEVLVAEKLCSGTVEQCVESESYKAFFPHPSSHFLGLDVHDVGRYRKDGESRALEPGMVLTVEPGLYFPRQAETPPDLLGVGMRIEDDVLVTNDGHEVLSAQVPKKASEVEAACAG